MTDKELTNRFTYHPPINQAQLETYQEVRRRCLELARFIRTFSPESREQSIAITKLDEVMMWTNAAIARNT